MGGEAMTLVQSSTALLEHAEGTTSASLEKVVVLFSSLSNTIRLAILIRLFKREWSVKELATDLKMSQSALSQHLGKLRHAGVVRTRRDRQTVFYSCSDAVVERLLIDVGLTG